MVKFCRVIGRNYIVLGKILKDHKSNMSAKAILSSIIIKYKTKLNSTKNLLLISLNVE